MAAVRLRKNRSVMKEINRLQRQTHAKALKRVQLNEEYALRKLEEIIETCTQRIPKVDFGGNQYKDDQGRPVFKLLDPNSANQALLSLMKHLQMFEEKKTSGEDSGSGVLKAAPIGKRGEWNDQKN